MMKNDSTFSRMRLWWITLETHKCRKITPNIALDTLGYPHQTWHRRVARMLRVWRTHHPYADFFFFLADALRFLIAHATNTKTQMKKNEPSGLLLRLVYWLKVDSKSRHFVEKRPAVSIDIESASAFAINFDSEIGSTFRAPRPSQ